MKTNDDKGKIRKIEERRAEIRNKEYDADDNVSGKTDSGEPEGKSPSKKSPIKRLTFGSLFILLFMLLYIPSLLNWLSGRTISSDILRNGTIEESISASGLIVRDEETVKASPFDGRVIEVIGEGEKTPFNTCIATILNKQSDSLLSEIETVNAKIVKAQMEKAEKADFFSEDLVKLDGEIGLRVQDLITASNSRSFEDMGKYRREIELIVEKKAEIIGENSTDTYVNTLKQQRETLQKKLNGNTVQVVSNSSGIVSYVIDGLEKILTPEKRKTLTPERFDEISAGFARKKETDSMAHAGKPLAKVIKGTDIYIVAALKTADLKNCKTGDRINLRVNGENLDNNAAIDFISNPVNGRSIVSIRTSRGEDMLSAVREVDIELVSKTEEGLKVPLNCLRNFSPDGKKADIMLIKDNVAALRKVELICRDKEYAIIKTPEEEMKKAVGKRKTVNLYDTYIINPDKVTEGDIVQK